MMKWNQRLAAAILLLSLCLVLSACTCVPTNSQSISVPQEADLEPALPHSASNYGSVDTKAAGSDVHKAEAPEINRVGFELQAKIEYRLVVNIFKPARDCFKAPFDYIVLHVGWDGAGNVTSGEVVKYYGGEKAVTSPTICKHFIAGEEGARVTFRASLRNQMSPDLNAMICEYMPDHNAWYWYDPTEDSKDPWVIAAVEEGRCLPHCKDFDTY